MKYKSMKKSGRLTALEIQGLFTAGALSMYATELKNEQKDELLKIVKDSGKHVFLAHCFPQWSTRRPLELLGSNTWASISLRRWVTSEHSLEVETGRWVRIKDREKRICKECHRQSDGFCSEVADEWHALGVLCPRGDQRKIEVLEFLTKLLRIEQIEVKKDDGLAEVLPKLGLLSGTRCLVW